MLFRKKESGIEEKEEDEEREREKEGGKERERGLNSSHGTLARLSSNVEFQLVVPRSKFGLLVLDGVFLSFFVSGIKRSLEVQLCF